MCACPQLPPLPLPPLSYNKVNNEPACLSNTLLNKVLRQQLGFKGFVATDCDGAPPLGQPPPGCCGRHAAV